MNEENDSILQRKRSESRCVVKGTYKKEFIVKVLVACEFSGIVRDAFIAKGHDAMSCDLLPTERPGPHTQGDIL